MRRRPISLLIITLLIAIGMGMVYLEQDKKEPEPKKLVAKFSFGKQGEGLGEFNVVGGLAIKENHLYVADSGNQRIQILKINQDGGLSPHSAFGKQGKGLGEFNYSLGLAIKENHLYVADTYNIHILDIKYVE